MSKLDIAVLIFGGILFLLWFTAVIDMSWSKWKRNYIKKKRLRAENRLLKAKANMADHCATREDWELINENNRTQIHKE